MVEEKTLEFQDLLRSSPPSLLSLSLKTSRPSMEMEKDVEVTTEAPGGALFLRSVVESFSLDGFSLIPSLLPSV